MWPFTGRSEKRAVDYTDRDCFARLLSQASGVDVQPEGCARSKRRAGLWGRAFADCHSRTPSTAATAALDAYTLGCMGRSLFKHGAVPRGDCGRRGWRLFGRRQTLGTIEGTWPLPWQWFYRADVCPPVDNRHADPLMASRVVHIRLARGRAAGQRWGATVDLLAALDAKLADGSRTGLVGSIMPVPPGTEGPELSADIRRP